MSYEHGSLDLGIKNPFKLVGILQASRGILVALMAGYLLINVAGLVQSDDKVTGWLYAGLGLVLMVLGLKDLAAGLFRVFRFFVGRSVPTSLAKNLSKSELNTAKQEKQDLGYDSQLLEQMLIGRKNLTFIEPQGWMARLAHTVFPKLTFLPYPIRNISQRMIDALAKTLVALLSFGIVLFLVSAGLIETQSSLLLDSMALLLLIYLIVVWSKTGARMNESDGVKMQQTSSSKFALIIVLSFILPVGLVYGGDYLLALLNSVKAVDVTIGTEFFARFSDSLTSISLAWFFFLIIGLAALVLGPLMVLVHLRAQQTNPITEVSEVRENWQESVHPKEIFINIDNIIMANRRYKEVPNRVYRDLDPKLNQETDGKGDFKGEMIQETQPVFSPLTLPVLHKWMKIFLSVVGNVLLLVSAWLLVNFVLDIPVVASAISANWDILSQSRSSANIADAAGSIVSLLTGLANVAIAWLIVRAFGRLATHTSYVFWAEMTFKSMLIYLKCEGTFSESRISTGTGVYDSTRSENTVVRSSITPWIVVSNVMTSTFAGVGQKNLEYPRHILEMHKDDGELEAIIGDMKHFLGQREAIASVKNDKDLAAADNIYQINQQTRAGNDGLAEASAEALAQEDKKMIEAKTHQEHAEKDVT